VEKDDKEAAEWFARSAEQATPKHSLNSDISV